MKGLVLGLGNEILCDDAVGIRVARRLAQSLHHPGWEVAWEEIGPLETMERLVGRDAAIIIDSAVNPEEPPGRVSCFPFARLPKTEHLGWSHGIDLATAMELGAGQGYRLPQRLSVITINIRDNSTLSECMTPELEREFEAIVARVKSQVALLLGRLGAFG